MAGGYTRFRSALRVLADAAGGLAKIVYGTPGSLIQYPAAGVPGSKSRETGSAWEGYGIPWVLKMLGEDLDKRWNPWAHVWTNTTGNSPTINNHDGVSSVTKDEGVDTITVNLSPVMTNNRYTVVARVESQVFVDELTSISAGSFTLRFNNLSGSVQDINSRMVMIQIRGQM